MSYNKIYCPLFIIDRKPLFRLFFNNPRKYSGIYYEQDQPDPAIPCPAPRARVPGGSDRAMESFRQGPPGSLWLGRYPRPGGWADLSGPDHQPLEYELQGQENRGISDPSGSDQGWMADRSPRMGSGLEGSVASQGLGARLILCHII